MMKDAVGGSDLSPPVTAAMERPDGRWGHIVCTTAHSAERLFEPDLLLAEAEPSRRVTRIHRRSADGGGEKGGLR